MKGGGGEEEEEEDVDAAAVLPHAVAPVGAPSVYCCGGERSAYCYGGAEMSKGGGNGEPTRIIRPQARRTYADQKYPNPIPLAEALSFANHFGRPWRSKIKPLRVRVNFLFMQR